MPSVRQVLGWKILVTAIVALPLAFLPLRMFPDIQIPEYDQVSIVFIRSLGAALGALLVVQLWGWIEKRSLRAGVIAALAESVLMAMAMWHFIFYGYLQSWPTLGKGLLLGLGSLYALFAVLLLVTGLGSLFGDDETNAPPAAAAAPRADWPTADDGIDRS